MNTLIITAAGSEGGQILVEAVKKVWQQDPFVVVTKPKPGCSLAITLPSTLHQGEPHVTMEETSPRNYTVEGTPADALYVAMCWAERILGPSRGFDLVLTGINQGHNCGLDALHSGTVMTAALAASVFGLPSMAFSQRINAPRHEEQKPEFGKREHFKVAEALTAKFLQEQPKTGGYCTSINFPAVPPKGYKRTQLALRSRWFPDYSPIRGGEFDMDLLDQGYVTMSDLNLSMAEQLRA